MKIRFFDTNLLLFFLYIQLTKDLILEIRTFFRSSPTNDAQQRRRAHAATISFRNNH